MKKWVLGLIGVLVVLAVVSLYYSGNIYPAGFSTMPLPPDAAITGIYIPSTAKAGEKISISLAIKNNENVDITCQSGMNPHYDVKNGEVILPSISLEPSEVKNITHSVIFSEPGTLSGEIRVYCQTEIIDYDPRRAGSPYFRKSGRAHVLSELSLPPNVKVEQSVIKFDINVSE